MPSSQSLPDESRRATYENENVSEDARENVDEHVGKKAGASAGDNAANVGTGQCDDAPVARSGWLVRSVVAFICAGLLVWVVLSWSQYRNQSRDLGTWQRGKLYRVELTVVPSDKQGLACAFDGTTKDIDGLRCGYSLPTVLLDVPESQRIVPYTTTNRENLFGAGMWSQIQVPPGEGNRRFTVSCLFRVKGAAAPFVRWTDNGPFNKLLHSWPVGPLTDCVVVR